MQHPDDSLQGPPVSLPSSTTASETQGLEPPLPGTWCAKVPWERLGWIVLVGVFLAAIPLVLYRTTHWPGSDFPPFYRSGQYLLENGARDPNSKFAHYLPSADVAMAMLAWMPFPVAAVVWDVMNTLSWVLLLTSVHRYLLPGYNRAVMRQAVLAAGLLLLPLVLDHLCIGAFHMFMVWLMVAGLGRVSQGRQWSGGLMLGLAVWVKLLPLMGVAYLVWKRKWLPAVVAMATVAFVDITLCLAAFSPTTAWELHAQWWKGEAQGRRNRMFVLTERIGEDRLTNQSVPIIARRVLTHMGAGNPARDAIALGNLTPDQLKTVYYSVMGLLGLAIMAYCRRPGRDLSPSQWATEISLILLSTLWFCPLVWAYHPTSAIPALAILVARSPKHTKTTWMIVITWLLSQILLAWPVAGAAGVLLWENLLVGAVLVWTSRNATSPTPSQTGPETDAPITPHAQRRPLGNRQSVPT